MGMFNIGNEIKLLNSINTYIHHITWTLGKHSLRSFETDSMFYQITEINQIMDEIHNLLEAAGEGNLDDVKKYLNRGVPVDSKDDRVGANDKRTMYCRVSTI